MEPTATAEPAPETQPPAQDEKKAASLLEALFGGAAQAEGATLEELKAALADAQARLTAAEAEVEALSARHDSLRETLNAQDAALREAQDALSLIEDGEISIQNSIEAALAQKWQGYKAKTIFDKPTFGSRDLGEYLLRLKKEGEMIESITLTGVCTDICVISNALLIKAYLPETEVRVEADLCAGVTKESQDVYKRQG